MTEARALLVGARRGVSIVEVRMVRKPENCRENLKLATGQDRRFAIRNRRDKLLRSWAADVMDRAVTDANLHARDIVRVGLAAADDTSIDRVTASIMVAGRAISIATIIDETNGVAASAAQEYGQPAAGGSPAAQTARGRGTPTVPSSQSSGPA